MQNRTISIREYQPAASTGRRMTVLARIGDAMTKPRPTTTLLQFLQWIGTLLAICAAFAAASWTIRDKIDEKMNQQLQWQGTVNSRLSEVERRLAEIERIEVEPVPARRPPRRVKAKPKPPGPQGNMADSPGRLPPPAQIPIKQQE